MAVTAGDMQSVGTLGLWVTAGVVATTPTNFAIADAGDGEHWTLTVTGDAGDTIVIRNPGGQDVAVIDADVGTMDVDGLTAGTSYTPYALGSGKTISAAGTPATAPTLAAAVAIPMPTFSDLRDNEDGTTFNISIQQNKAAGDARTLTTKAAVRAGDSGAWTELDSWTSDQADATVTGSGTGAWQGRLTTYDAAGLLLSPANFFTIRVTDSARFDPGNAISSSKRVLCQWIEDHFDGVTRDGKYFWDCNCGIVKIPLKDLDKPQFRAQDTGDKDREGFYALPTEGGVEYQTERNRYLLEVICDCPDHVSNAHGDVIRDALPGLMEYAFNKWRYELGLKGLERSSLSGAAEIDMDVHATRTWLFEFEADVKFARQ